MSDPVDPIGVVDVMALDAAMEGARLCALGYHAWTPWLKWNEHGGGSWVTFCARPACDHQEQWDV